MADADAVTEAPPPPSSPPEPEPELKKPTLKERVSTLRTVLSKTSSVQDGRYDKFVCEHTESRPRGYPRLASYISADIDGRLYRRFAYVRNRLLLHAQDKILELEEKLDKLDADDEKDDFYRLCSRRYDEEDPATSKRPQLLDELSVKLKEYDDLLIREHTIMSIRQPDRKMHRGYFDYVWNAKPVCREEYQFIYHQDDFVALGLQEDGWLGSYTAVLARILPRVILKYLLSSKEDRRKSDDEAGVHFFSNERTAKVVKAIVGAAITVLLIVPIIVLYVLAVHNATGGLKIGVLLIFVVAFAVTLAAMTRASRHEMFGASAAYAAVLVVFLGNVPQA